MIYQGEISPNFVTLITAFSRKNASILGICQIDRPVERDG